MEQKAYAALVRETRLVADRFFENNPEAWDAHLQITILENPDVSPARFAHDVRLFETKRRLSRLQC